MIATLATLEPRHSVELSVPMLRALAAAARAKAARARSPQLRRELESMAAYLSAAAQTGERQGRGELLQPLSWFGRLCGLGVCAGRDAFALGRLLGPGT